MTLHPQSTGLTYVIETVTVMKAVLQVIKGARPETLSEETKTMLASLRGDTNQLKLDIVWKELQGHVDHVLDREMKTGVTNKVKLELQYSQITNFIQTRTYHGKVAKIIQSNRQCVILSLAVLK